MTWKNAAAVLFVYALVAIIAAPTVVAWFRARRRDKARARLDRIRLARGGDPTYRGALRAARTPTLSLEVVTDPKQRAAALVAAGVDGP